MHASIVPGHCNNHRIVQLLLKVIFIASTPSSLYLLDWITGLTFDPQIPTKMSNFSAIDSLDYSCVLSCVSIY